MNKCKEKLENLDGEIRDILRAAPKEELEELMLDPVFYEDYALRLHLSVKEAFISLNNGKL